MRCKECREKFEVKYFNQKFCMDKTACIKAFNDWVSDEKFNKLKTDRKPYTHSKEYKKELQDNINLLSRKIDAYFGFNCIDCDSPFGKQTDAAHLHNVSGNENIRYNLHNLHSARSHCNRYSSEHKVGYRKGIEKRYSKAYLEYIDFEIGITYAYIGLNEVEVVEKLAIVRKLNRDFKTFKLKDGISARDMFNKIIGIYENQD